MGYIIPDQKIYKAANLFAKGEFQDCEDTLKEYGFSDKECKNILKLADAHYSEDDNGYEAFLEIINELLGQPVYEVEDREEV